MAEWLGRLLRHLLVGAARVLSALPGLAAPALVVYGVALIYPPVAWIVAGVFLFLLDRRV